MASRARFMSPAAAELRLETRTLAWRALHPTVLAPANWTDVRIAAWLDALESEDDLDPTLPLGGAVRRAAERLGGATSSTRSVRAAELEAAMLLGLAAPGQPRGDPPPIADLSTPQGRDRLDAHLAQAAASRLGGGVRALHGRLVAVREAVVRCDGPASACADPTANPALARALRAARAAGADDALLLDAVDGRLPPAPARRAAAPLLIAVGDCLEAQSMSDRIVRAPDLDRAYRAARGLAGADVTLNVAAWVDAKGELDETGLTALARLWAAALGPDPVIALAGLWPAVIAQGLAPASDAGCEAAAWIGCLVAEAAGVSPVLLDDGDAAVRLGVPSGAAPWSGPVYVDGSGAVDLEPAALSGLQRLDIDAARAREVLLGGRRLEGAPYVDPAALRSRGFTDHELDALRTALPIATSLEALFSPAVLGEGFCRDVLGARDGLAGLDAGQRQAAAGWLLGDPSGQALGGGGGFAGDALPRREDRLRPRGLRAVWPRAPSLRCADGGLAERGRRPSGDRCRYLARASARPSHAAAPAA